jgi:hypothetical protein
MSSRSTKASLRFCLFLAAVLLPGIAAAQPVTMPTNTVWGRLGIGPGPGSAIPIASLLSGSFGTGVAAALAKPLNTSGGLATSAGPTFSGTILGTYTLGGSPTITAPVINGGTLSGTIGGAPALSGANFISLNNMVQDSTAWSLFGNPTSGTATIRRSRSGA